ncbi:MAG: fatty-acyl-CoA synthase [Rhodospirillales bacterium]|nr:MAG: fatty-acyl-CoA synthase [Rhodospirillales bacterium]
MRDGAPSFGNPTAGDAMLVERTLAWSERRPNRPALVQEGAALSFGDLRRRVVRIAHHVRAVLDAPAAVGDPDRPAAVGLLLRHGIAMPEMVLGSALGGAAAAVFDPQWSGSELRRVVERVAPRLVFADPALAETVAAMAPGAPCVALGGGAYSFEAWVSDPAAAPLQPNDAESPFYIGLTSGTTGTPKAFVRSHRSWTATLDAACAEFPLPAGAHVLIPGRLHQSLFLWAVVETAAAGATAHLLPRFDAEAALACLADAPIVRIHGVPTMYAAMVEAASRNKRCFSGVRTVLSAGAKLAPSLRSALAQVFPEAEIIEYYGASETSFVTVARGRENPPPDSVGRPFPGVGIVIRRSDGEPAAAGETGRLCLQSAMLCSGYLGRQDGSGFRIGADGWATVGDLGRVDRDGWVYLAGREGDMVVTGGVNVYPAEVEAALARLPEVAETVVFGVADPYWGERLIAVVRWAGGAVLGREELRRRLAAELSRPKCPQQFFVTDRFPLTGGGKVAVTRLRQQVISGDPGLIEVG